ncbi:hypothetical protein HPB50_023317 [Hyalomma asiaticum]|uniref:Uncharacterized protein n=1 Tax=Hyalomma asiaticum TaxID=266040 RepID=A0ACB7S382_HYAAI|nr:hypothetical protein HPB50_023317 [Hyalomma asiaticum]
MAEPRPTANATAAAASAAAGPDQAPESAGPPGNPAVATSLGPDSFFSSQEEMVFEEVPDTRSLFFIAWVFCCVGSIIVFVPLAFILMPLFSGAVARIKAPAVATTLSQVTATTAKTKTTVTTKSTKLTMPTWIVPSTTAVAVPAFCRKTRPAINVDMKDIADDSFKTSTLKKINSSHIEVYCLFNISRVHRRRGVDFLLHQFPWPICPNVIYWSFSVNVSDGRLHSRAPGLDAYNGFYNITSVARRYSTDTNVLFTLGGYPEDSGLFSLLGSGTLAENTLVQTMIMMLYRLMFNGINIDLVEDQPCEQFFKNKMAGLQSFIAELKKLVGINRPVKNFKITLMVGTKKQLAKDAVSILGDDIDRVFLDTFQMFSTNFSKRFDHVQFCETHFGFLHRIKHEMDMAMNGDNDIHRKFCYSYSSLTRTWSNKNKYDGGPPLAVTDTYGFASYQDLCAQGLRVQCQKGGYYCSAATITGARGIVVATAYVFVDTALLNSYSNKCLLFYNLDYGVHPTACSGSVSDRCDALTLFADTFKQSP